MHSTGSTASAIICRQRCTSSMTNCLSLEEALSSSWASRLSPGFFRPPAGRTGQRLGEIVLIGLSQAARLRGCSAGTHIPFWLWFTCLQQMDQQTVPWLFAPSAGTSVDAAALGAALLWAQPCLSTGNQTGVPGLKASLHSTQNTGSSCRTTKCIVLEVWFVYSSSPVYSPALWFPAGTPV